MNSKHLYRIHWNWLLFKYHFQNNKKNDWKILYLNSRFIDSVIYVIL